MHSDIRKSKLCYAHSLYAISCQRAEGTKLNLRGDADQEAYLLLGGLDKPRHIVPPPC